ncbi:unnamed protein product [Auanema sp. JU1783]|nr:unnamed protein product [Auanema sp. JU1783]
MKCFSLMFIFCAVACCIYADKRINAFVEYDKPAYPAYALLTNNKNGGSLYYPREAVMNLEKRYFDSLAGQSLGK